jgi:hypothetical protein
MSEDCDPAQPRSMTSMAGLIDDRVNPTGGQPTGDESADRMVRAQPYRHFAAGGEDEKAEAIRAFYDSFAHPEYRHALSKHSSAAMDLPELSDASLWASALRLVTTKNWSGNEVRM